VCVSMWVGGCVGVGVGVCGCVCVYECVCVKSQTVATKCLPRWPLLAV